MPLKRDGVLQGAKMAEARRHLEGRSGNGCRQHISILTKPDRHYEPAERLRPASSR